MLIGDDYIAEQEQSYSERGDIWGNFDKTHPRYNLYQQYNKVIISMIPDHVFSVIDIGCGYGGLVKELIECGYNVMGVDSSPSAIEQAKTHHPTQFDIFEVGDIRTYVPKSPVDMVIITGPYYHLDAKIHSA